MISGLYAILTTENGQAWSQNPLSNNFLESHGVLVRSVTGGQGGATQGWVCEKEFVYCSEWKLRPDHLERERENVACGALRLGVQSSASFYAHHNWGFVLVEIA